MFGINQIIPTYAASIEHSRTSIIIISIILNPHLMKQVILLHIQISNDKFIYQKFQQ